MSLSMYQASVPVLIHNLKALSAILKKGADHAKARGLDPTVLVNARLFPDMFPLVRQVQIATDMAKGGAARLAGVEIPSFPDTESSFHFYAPVPSGPKILILQLNIKVKVLGKRSLVGETSE